MISEPLSPRQTLCCPYQDHSFSPLSSGSSFSVPFCFLPTLYMVRRYIKSKLLCLVFQGLPILALVTLSLTGLQYQSPMILRPSSLQNPFSTWSFLFPILYLFQYLPLYLSIFLPVVSLHSHLLDASYNSTSSSGSISPKFLKSEPCSLALNY